MAHNLTDKRPASRNAILRGKRAEWYTQDQLAMYEIESKRLDFVYDLLLPEYDYKIEVKSSKIHTRPDGVNTKKMGTPYYSFKFNDNQIQKDDSYDWAVCVGYNNRKKVKDVFIIPQPYIAYNGKNFLQINIRPSNKLEWCGDSYSKYEVNKNLNLEDIFKQKNKRSFKMLKTRHTNRLKNFGRNHDEKLGKEIRQFLESGTTLDEASKHFNVAWQTIRKALDRYGIDYKVPKRGEHLKKN